MGNSLQDQLIGAGLVDEKKAKQLKAEQSKKRRKKRKTGHQGAQSGKSASQRVNPSATRDRELNRRREQERARKALAVQIRQLVEAHGVAEEKEAEEAYNFVDGGKVKKIYVSEKSRASIGSGKLAIVRVDRRYRLMPSEYVEKLRQRDHDCVVLHNASGQATISTEDEEYPEHRVPDDLMW